MVWVNAGRGSFSNLMCSLARRSRGIKNELRVAPARSSGIYSVTHRYGPASNPLLTDVQILHGDR